VSLYTSLPPREVSYIVHDSGSSVFIVSTRIQLKKALDIYDACPDLKHIVSMTELEDDHPEYTSFFDAAIEEGRALYEEYKDAIHANEASVKPDDLAAPFRDLCDQASEAGLLVHLEFMPFTVVNDLDTALRVLDASGREEAGIMLDVWHFVRSGSSRATLAKEAKRVLAVQLDDCPAQAEANLIDETLHRRLMPGEGDADVAGLIRTLDEGGCTAPLGVEVFAEELETLAPRDGAVRTADATRKVIAEARGSGARVGEEMT